MNIFKVLASGKHAFREEFLSAFLAYLLSPKMDHGLGSIFLTSLLSQVAERNQSSPLKAITDNLKSRLWENIFEENGGQPVVELEVAYPGGWIDIVVRIGNWFVLIENKILAQSKTEGQIKAQYDGLQKVIEQRGFEGEYNILLLYLVPAIGSEEEWTVPTGFFDELDKINLRPNDQKSLITWQPVSEDGVEGISVVSTIRQILTQESRGMMSPLSLEIRHALLSLVDFSLGNFRGFHYQRATSRDRDTQKKRVSELLQMEGDFWVGVQYGRGGLVSVAWKNPAFINAELNVTEDDSVGWQYLPIKDFKTFVRWAMHPDEHTLEGVEWYGKPFWAENLYRVAKWGKANFFIGLKGGLSALEDMSIEEVKDRKFWELNSEQKNQNWISTKDYCKALENMGLYFD